MLPASISGLTAAARDLPALGVDRKEAGDLAREHLDYRRTVGFVLDQLRESTGPLRRKLANRVYCGGAVHSSADLIAQQEHRPQPPPYLANDVVGSIEILERAIPGLDRLIDSVR